MATRGSKRDKAKGNPPEGEPAENYGPDLPKQQSLISGNQDRTHHSGGSETRVKVVASKSIDLSKDLADEPLHDQHNGSGGSIKILSKSSKTGRNTPRHLSREKSPSGSRSDSRSPSSESEKSFHNRKTSRKDRSHTPDRRARSHHRSKRSRSRSRSYSPRRRYRSRSRRRSSSREGYRSRRDRDYYETEVYYSPRKNDRRRKHSAEHKKQDSVTNDEMPPWAKTLLDKVNALENNVAGSNAPQIVVDPLEINNFEDQDSSEPESDENFNFKRRNEPRNEDPNLQILITPPQGLENETLRKGTYEDTLKSIYKYLPQSMCPAPQIKQSQLGGNIPSFLPGNEEDSKVHSLPQSPILDAALKVVNTHLKGKSKSPLADPNLPYNDAQQFGSFCNVLSPPVEKYNKGLLPNTSGG